MDVIDLQSKAIPKRGKIEAYWFENENIGLPRTLFHRLYLPFEPMDTGLEYVGQPETTEICYEWLTLRLEDQSALDGLNLSSANYPDAEASIYVGAAHNPIEFDELSMQETKPGLFTITAEMTVLFEFEGVARNERFSLETEASFEGVVGDS